MKKLLTIFLMLLGAVAQAQNFAITATTEAAIRKNVVRGNAANYGFGMINDTLRLIGLNTRYDISTGSFSKNTVGLGNVDNTSDANKPISTATQTALNLKANIASPTFTGTVSGITKSMVGLGNVDNTSDANKPISTATQTSLDLKANLESPTFTGTVAGITKNMVGLGSVDNTTDAAKPISTATQTALDAKQATLNGTGFVKSTAGTISYDNSTYLTTFTAASTYLPISNPTATGTLTAPTIANSLGANFATTSGNVGIGTTTPNAKLDVVGNVFASGNNPIVGGTTGVGIGLTGGFPQVYLRDNAAATDTKTWDTYAAGTIMYSRVVNDASSNAQVWQQVQRSGATISSVSFPNGNVGIGVTSPAYKLDVSGSFNANSIYTKDDQNGYAGNYGRYSVAYPYATFSTSGTWGYDWQINGASKMMMFANGRVGINTTTDAGYLLDVNGTAKVTGNVSIGTTLNTRTLQVHTTTNNVNFESANNTTTGNNYSISSYSFGVGATLNVAALLQASGATSNYGLRIFNVAASANNYAIYSDSPAQSYFQGGIGIGTTTPAASAILDITSTTQGVLFPRLTTTEINAITSPADGLTVYNTTLKAICFYDSSAAAWRKVSHSAM